MSPRTSKKTAKPVKKTATKRRLSKAHAVIIGAGLLSSIYIAKSIPDMRAFRAPVAITASDVLPTPQQSPPPAGLDLSVFSAEFRTNAGLSEISLRYAIKNTGPAFSPSRPIKILFEWLNSNGGVVGTANGQDWFSEGAGSLMYNKGIGAGAGKVPLSFFKTPPSTAVSLKITLDPGNLIAETQEGNNKETVPVAADVRLMNTTISPDGNLSFTVVNNGPATIPAYRVVVVNTNGTQAGVIGTFQSASVTSTLAPFNAVTFNNSEPVGSAMNAFIHQYMYGARAARVRIYLPTGFKVLAAKADTDVLVKYPLPNLVIDQATYSVGSDLTYTVSNIGTWSADRPEVTLNWANPVNSSIKKCITGSSGCSAFLPNSVLKPGESASFTQPASSLFITNRPVNASKMILSVKAGNGQQFTTSELPKTITWSLPDLVLTDASFDAQKKFHYAVKNFGPMTAAGFEVSFQWKNSVGTSVGNAVKLTLPNIGTQESVMDSGLSSSQISYFFTVIPPTAKKLVISVNPNFTKAESSIAQNTLEIPRPN